MEAEIVLGRQMRGAEDFLLQHQPKSHEPYEFDHVIIDTMSSGSPSQVKAQPFHEIWDRLYWQEAQFFII